MNREEIMAALFALLSASVAGLKTSGRRLKFPHNIAEQPALFLDDRGTEYEQSATGMPPKRTLMADIWLYTNDGKNPDAVPATGLNIMIDAVELALKPSPIFGTQTLGNLVQHCWIEGRPEYFSGHLGGQAIAVLPIRMLVP